MRCGCCEHCHEKEDGTLFCDVYEDETFDYNTCEDVECWEVMDEDQ